MLHPKRLPMVEKEECPEGRPILNSGLNLSLDDWMFEPGEGFFDSGVDQEEKVRSIIECPLVLVDNSIELKSDISVKHSQYIGLLHQDEYFYPSPIENSSPPHNDGDVASDNGTDNDEETSNVLDIRARPSQAIGIKSVSSIFPFLQLNKLFFFLHGRELNGLRIYKHKDAHLEFLSSWFNKQWTIYEWI